MEQTGVGFSLAEVSLRLNGANFSALPHGQGPRVGLSKVHRCQKKGNNGSMHKLKKKETGRKGAGGPAAAAGPLPAAEVRGPGAGRLLPPRGPPRGARRGAGGPPPAATAARRARPGRAPGARAGAQTVLFSIRKFVNKYLIVEMGHIGIKEKISEIHGI